MASLHALLVTTSLLVACAGGVRKVMDLTYPHGHSSFILPGIGIPPYQLDVLFKNFTDNGIWIEYNSFCTGEHVGTHIDAPAHFAQGKWKVHEIPAERFIGPGVIINVKSEAAANNDYRVTVDDLMIWEAANGRIPHNAFVIMNSGWGSRFPNVSLVLNSDDLGNATSYHFPGFHGDAARWLLANRNVSMLGVDTPSVDYAQTHDFDVHVVLYANNVPGLENVAYLDQVPDAGAMIYAFPLKLEHGSGSPVRIVAITDDKVPISRCFIVQWSSLASLLSVGMCIMLY